MHDPVRADQSFPTLEDEVLAFWREEGIPARVLSHREGAEEYVFYEGPPTANALPGTHHVLARAFKDVYTRFWTMRGRYVPRKAGWDCHGLPVEIEVEKKLGFTRKQQIVDYGVDRFNQLCRESVTEYVAAWERLSERMAFWLDYEDAYWTMSDEYIESVWWSLTELHRRGNLFEAEKIVPYCPRCETPLSDHELGQPDVYREVSDPGVTLALPVDGVAEVGGHDLGTAALAVWTTTPWTLISNLAAAVHPDLEYALVEALGRRLILARDLVDRVAGEGARVLATFRGRDLVGLRYRPPFDDAREALSGDPDVRNAWQVVAADFVSAEEGTGIVHLAAAFGADDLVACRAAGIPTFNPVDRSGRFDARVRDFAGRFVKEADPDIVAALDRSGLLIRDERYVHSYPHCWRCHSPLIYYALRSWYVRTTAHRERLLETNAGINWIPSHIRDGRMGNWLENNVDWSLSRYRFWGTPLPVWRCPNGHDTLIESRAALGKAAGRDLSGLDLHRPFVDEVVLACSECGDEARRVPDLIDVWYDSGAMPFAQYGYPHRNTELFRRRFPAHFISEAIDQTRGWFYTLLAEATLIFDDTAYRNVVCLGHIVDENGRKMSKSLGNVIDPWEIFGRFGADALRFLFFSGGPPGDNKRLSYDALEGVVRGPFLTLWNVYRLYVLYANIDQFHPDSWPLVEPSMRPSLDRWALSELHQTIAEVTEALESYDATRASRRLIEFIDDLSNWYVRRSRRRFWREAATDEERADKAAAYWTLWTCLVETSKLLAPFAPLVSEALYRNLVVKLNPTAPPSIHLVDLPRADAGLIDPELALGMAAVRSLVSLGRSARTDVGVKVRQPLAEAVLLVPPDQQYLVEELEDVIAEELNVKEFRYAEEAGELVRVTLRPNYRAAGPDFGPRVRDLAEALAAAPDPAGLAEQLEYGDAVDVELPSGELVRVEPEHVEIRREPAEGTAFAYQAPYGISLDLEVTDDLRTEGLARELVHQLQGLRREAGLEVTDRVRVAVSAPAEVAEALREHGDWVREEVLAAELAVAVDEAALGGTVSAPAATVQVDGHEVRVALERA